MIHGDLRSFVEYLLLNQNLLKKNFRHLQTSFYTLNRTAFLEYNPLVNSRVHLVFKEKNNILNK